MGPALPVFEGSRVVLRQEMSGGTAPAVVLASQSVARAALLRNAGVRFSVRVSEIDENELKRSLGADKANARVVAESLAELKASSVSSQHEGALVVGADQVLDCDGVWFDKPTDLLVARHDLMALRGRAHALVTAVCVVRDGVTIWRYCDQARLVMRAFSDAFLDAYLADIGPSALGCVGAYQLEGPGMQLFAEIDGDHFSILGLPLLPLLEFLRSQGAVGR